jgi:hypothetical protein
MQILNEFSNKEPVIGVVLQEVAVTAATPVILNDTGSVVTFETTLQDDQPNRNKRIYPSNVLASAIASDRVQELLRLRSLFGEANHPFSADMSRQMVIDQTRISHLITDLRPPKNGIVTGTIETAATQCGRDMRGLIVENKSTLAFSMRGMGGVRRIPGKDIVEVTAPLALITYDWVVFPSHKSAVMASTMHEGCAVITASDAARYARDQSSNVQSLVEQFELENPEFTLTEDQMSLIVKSNQSIIKVFLEEDIRNEFRSALKGLL